MKLLRAALLSVALLSLASCSVFQFLLGSVFPSTVTLLKAQVDLSSTITSDDSNSFVVRTVRSAGKDYVVLSGSTGVNGNVMMFFDADLNLLMKVPSPYTQLFGAFATSTGQVIAGNNIYTSGLTSSSQFTPSTTAVNAGPRVGVDGFPTASLDVSISGGQGTTPSLFYQTITEPITTSSTFSSQITVPLSANPANTDLRIAAVLDDGSPTGNVIVVVVVSTSNDYSAPGTSYFLKISKASFASSVPPYLFDTAPHRDGLDPNSFGFADDHVIAYDTTIASYVLIDPSTGYTVAGGTFYSHVDPAQILSAYPPSGGFSYTWDPDSRALSKYSKWW